MMLPTPLYNWIVDSQARAAAHRRSAPPIRTILLLILGTLLLWIAVAVTVALVESPSKATSTALLHAAPRSPAVAQTLGVAVEPGLPRGAGCDDAAPPRRLPGRWWPFTRLSATGQLGRVQPICSRIAYPERPGSA